MRARDRTPENSWKRFAEAGPFTEDEFPRLPVSSASGSTSLAGVIKATEIVRGPLQAAYLGYYAFSRFAANGGTMSGGRYSQNGGRAKGNAASAVNGLKVRTTEATHLMLRDRMALAFRIVGAVAGFAIIKAAFTTSSWNRGWVIALFIAVVFGGAVSYHLLTSIVRCPGCGNGVVNLRIGPIEDRRKQFPCRRCGRTAWLAEGFYWQHDING